MGAAQTALHQGMQKREGFHASLICYHARLVKVKNVSADVSERQALSNLIRCSRSRDPIMKYDSLSLMSRVDVGASLAGLWHCRDVPLFPIISGWERSENRFKRLLSCVGMSKLLEWFLLFFRTIVRPHLVQADELHSFVGCHEKRLRFDAPKEWGSIWTWLALDNESKLIISHYIGQRDADSA